MKEYVIAQNDEGRRLDKYVSRILCNASASFIYKMLRKKNIVLNDTKATGSEKLVKGDRVSIYLSDETFDKFSRRSYPGEELALLMPPVIYEDDDILIVDKPSGMLSQRSSADDVSLNEICLAYLYRNGYASSENSRAFTPGICNRLDRNTSGLITFAKTYRCADQISGAFRSHKIAKFYRCIVAGCMDKDVELTGRLVKDKETNTVSVRGETDDGRFICTRVHPLKAGNILSLLEIELVTGKTHQIRAHLASAGHPLLGDEKYGDRNINIRYRKEYGITSQMLVCTKMVFPEDFAIGSIAGRVFETDVPEDFRKVMLCQPGIQEG